MHNILITISRPSTGSRKHFIVKRNLFIPAGPKSTRMMNPLEFKEFIATPLANSFVSYMDELWNQIEVKLANYGEFKEYEEMEIEV